MKLEISDREFNRFRDLVAERAGIYFDSSKRDALEMSLIRRMEACGLNAFIDYFLILSNPERADEFDSLLDLITIPETYFFRDLAQVMALKEYVIPDLIKKTPATDFTLGIWSAGCSTGEEPYTIAMLIEEGMPGVVYPPTHILATDVSNAALESARRGVYRPHSFHSMPEEYRHRFFSQQGDSYLLDDSIKKKVEFRYFNLMNEPYPVPETSGWDIIFCRNVTIYFQPESTKRVIHNFYESLRDGGYLFTGFSESLRYLSDEFTLVQLGGVSLYQKRTDGPEKKRPPKSTSTKRSRHRPRDAVQEKRGVRPDPSREEKDIGEVCVRASELLEAGHPELASKLLLPYLEGKTPPGDVALLLAEISLNQGELEEAAQLAESVVNRDPFSVVAHFLLGIVYLTMDDGDRAIAEFKRVLYLKPNHALARFYLGDIYSQSGKVEEAKLEYNNAVRLLNEGPDSFDERFAGGFSPTLLIETCNSRLHTLNSRQQAVNSKP